MAAKNTPDITITVIKKSDRGAWLITDGTHQCWVRPSCRRDDGTWTPSTYTAIARSTDPYITPEEQAKIDEARKQAWIDEQRAERERRASTVYILLHQHITVLDGSDKAYKIATGRKVQNPHKFKRSLIDEYLYLPKSHVSFRDTTGGGKILEIPTWLYETKTYVMSLIGVVKD